MKRNNNLITIMYPIISLGTGGAEQQLLELVRGIDKNHFRPIVVTLYPGGTVEKDLQKVPDVELICLNRRGKYDFSILLKILKLLRQRHVDIIQPFLTPATFFGLLPAMVNRVPVKIVTERCGVRVNTGLGNNLYRRVEDFLTRFADLAIPNSQAGYTYLIERGINPDRIRVIYNGINLARLTPDPEKVAGIRADMGVRPEGKIVGITASLSPAKDHITFLQAARIIIQSMPEVKFSIVGDGTLRKNLEDTTRELNLTSSVTFHGIQRDVGSYISAFDVACLCSSDHEGCSNATLEAMALEKPVVVTDIGGNRELVEHGKNGLLVPVRNPQALATAVLDCFNQPSWAREIGQHARETVLARFSLEHMVHEYEQIYEQAMQGKERVKA